jgi:tryptophan halogenase
MNNIIKEIVIIGGGLAGWLTSLHIKKIFGEDAKVSLIESESIGILGAGEGSTPNIITMLQLLDIDITEFISKTNGTYKLGISFENWNGNDKKYYHSFNELHAKLNWTKFKGGKQMGIEYLGYIFDNNINLNNCILSNVLSDEDKLPIASEEFNGTNYMTNYSVHFDAHLVAKYLRDIAQSRGIKRIEGIVDELKEISNGHIRQIILKSGQRVNSDFIFDCSGFARLVIGNHYKTNWIDYKDKLTVSSALPFTLPTSMHSTKPYTRAVAMKCGWMWMIPLQNRWGCGYIYDDSYINEEQAKKEVNEFLGNDIEFNKVINFEAGRFEKAWVNNCISIGLSSTFSEPIEATSIFIQIYQLMAITKDFIVNYIDGVSDESTRYNKYVAGIGDDIADFLQFHYFTKRQDTEFWKTYYDRTQKSDKLIKKIENWKLQLPTSFDFYQEPFSLNSWTLVGLGIEFFEKSRFIRRYKNYKLKDDIKLHHIQNIKNINNIKNKCFTQTDLLKK